MAIDNFPTSAVEKPLNSEPGVVESVETFIAQHPPTVGIYEGSLEDMQDGFYLSPNAVNDYDFNNLPQALAVEPLPGAQLGAGDSYHQVMMGDIRLALDGEIRNAKVAIKPFTTESLGAEHEHGALMGAQYLGFDTYKPVALAKNGETTYLLTEWRADVATFDGEAWDISPNDTERYQTEVAPNLNFIATSMAQMNSSGLFHGDAQIKNFAQDKEGNLVVIDLEDASIEVTPSAIAKRLIEGVDILQFWYAAIHSIDGRSPLFLEGEPFETCMQEFTDFRDIYLDGVLKYASPEVMQQIDLDALREDLFQRAARTT